MFLINQARYLFQNSIEDSCTRIARTSPSFSRPNCTDDLNGTDEINWPALDFNLCLLKEAEKIDFDLECKIKNTGTSGWGNG